MSKSTLVIVVLYELVALTTFVKLTFYDYYEYTWWNWIIVVPLNVFFAEVWPIYWLLRWIGEAIAS